MSRNVTDTSNERQTNGSQISKTDENKSPEDTKLVEARSAVILLRHSRFCTKNEYTQWLLKNLYQPLTRKDYDIMNVLYLSRHKKAIWKGDNVKDVPRTEDIPSETFVLSPRTNLMTLTYEYRIVYILDLSSSLATVGSTNPIILLSGAFESLRNSLEGIVQPFVLPISSTQNAMLRPNFTLTVMADCSQFASNMNVIPMLAEHPTMRVFMQNVTVNQHNVYAVIDQLYSEFLAFQKDTTNFRHFLKRKRSNQEYNLDVGDVGPREVSDLETPSLPTLKSRRTESSLSDGKDDDQEMPLAAEEETSYHSSKREVWGIGKSGANLSRILHAGHFAIKLLPADGRPQLILITDGAMKSNVNDNTFVRQFSDEDVTCHIIQVGSTKSFIPGRNFGFVPDNEILAFLTRATGGSLIYADECEPVKNAAGPQWHDGDRVPHDTRKKSMNDDTIHNLPDSVLQYLPADNNDYHPPNMYHCKFLFRETTLTRSPDVHLQPNDHRDLNHSRDQSMEKQRVGYNFPWDPSSYPPQPPLRLLKYREYPLPAEFSHIIATRTREGFTLQSVSFDDGTGLKNLDTALRSLQAPDLGAIRKERIQIVMALHWQPNVVIEYRIRATWLPMVIGPTSQLKYDPMLLHSSIFGRSKAPRAEIFVRTDAEFAHMLQNWDIFRRRAQMMGVVTGATFLSDVYTAPVYAKTEKLRNYLVDIFEDDEVLKTLIGFNSKYLQSLTSIQPSAPAHRGIEISQQRGAYLVTFREFWDKLNAANTRSRTRSWYDHDFIDLLIGDVSPYMSPELTSAYNQEFISNVETEVNTAIQNIRTVMGRIMDFEGQDGTFVKVMNRMITNAENKDANTMDYFSYSLGYPPSFYEVRVRREYGRLVSLRLLFFNMDVSARQRAKGHLLYALKTSQETSAAYNYLCERPFSSLLMRDPKHFQDMAEPKATTPTRQRATTLTRRRTWYLPPILWLTSEYIVRDYLRHMTWSWQTDNYQDQYHKENKMMPVHDLAFQFLCQARLDQGYHLVSPRPDSTHFYQETYLSSNDKNRRILCAIQYFIWKDSVTGKITTELWMEPSGNLDQYELVKAWTLEPDRRTISQLVTFDQIHAAGRSGGKGDYKEKRRGSKNSLDDTMAMRLPQLFDVATVLRSNAFVVASFGCPQYQLQRSLTVDYLQVSETPSTRKRKRYRRLSQHHLLFDSTIENDLPGARNMCLRPDPVLNRNKEAMAQLDVRFQSFALLHYFIERTLDRIADGEVVMSSQNCAKGFWLNIQKALMDSTQEHCVSSTRLTTDLRQMRCFIHIFDARSFVIVLFPMIDSIVASLSNLDNEPLGASSSSLQDNLEAKEYRIDFMLFECVRQKPMKPIKTTEYARDLPIGSHTNIRLEEDNDITVTGVDYLLHEQDGLSGPMRPRLLEGQFKNRCARNLSERTLTIAHRISQLYSKAYVRSLYTCLLRGHAVTDEDLAKALELCEETKMEINITEFVNVMTLQQHGDQAGNFSRVPEIQDRFMTILRHYFEPLRTTSGRETHLFYYKPFFSRDVDVSDTEDADLRDKRISLLVDLAVNSQTPLFIRLECVYSPPQGDDVVCDFTELPTTFKGKSKAGQSFDFGPEIQEDGGWSPLEATGTEISLHLVCLNMPRSSDDTDEYSVLDHSDDKEALIAAMQSPPECFATLAADQQEALAETEARIRWLLTEETLHGLLKLEHVTIPTLRYVERQLSRNSLFVDFPTSQTVPFHFVKDLVHSRETFMEELEKEGQTGDSYRLQRMGDYFYVSQDSMYNMLDEAALSSTETSPVSLEPTEMFSNYDLSEGLGISTIYPEKQEVTKSIASTVPFGNRPLYWLVLIPKERYVQLFFYSKLQSLVDRSDILQRVKDKLFQVQERTNRLMLLRSLQETRICSKFLEPAAGKGKGEQSSEKEEEEEEEAESDEETRMFTVSEKDGSLIATGKFVPGQFACPIVFTRRFPLHWRLQPNVALKYLTADVLRLFIVHNRPQMFVIERDNSIVYCKIYEEDVSADHDERLPFTHSPVPTESAYQSPVLERKTPTSRATGSTLSADTCRELVLEVHGIDLPDWIEQEFVGLVENRLISHITLNEIQQFFLRNPNSKPTMADVQFILPMEKQPACTQLFRLPNMVGDPHALMQLFQRAVLSENIRIFGGPNVSAAVKVHLDDLYGDPSHGHMCFYYNCKQRVPGTSSSLEMAAGQGIAGICVSGQPLCAPENERARDMDLDPKSIRRCLEGDFLQDNSAMEKLDQYTFRVDIWAIGSVDSGALMNHMYESFRQSLCDFFIEKTVTIDISSALQKAHVLGRSKGVGRVLRRKFIESILYILQKATEWKSPTVYAMNTAVDIMPWCMDDVVDFVNCELCNIDTSLRMTIVWRQPNRSLGWELYHGQKSLEECLQNDIQLVGISGLSEFVERLGSALDMRDRRTSVESDVNSQRSRRSSAASHGSLKRLKTDEKDLSRSSSTSRSMSATFDTKSSAARGLPRTDPGKHCFLLMTLNVDSLAIYTYNWTEKSSLNIFDSIFRVSMRQEARHHILSNILHQKMGLFHHGDSIKATVDTYSSLPLTIDNQHLLSKNTHIPSPKQLPSLKKETLSSKNIPAEAYAASGSSSAREAYVGSGTSSARSSRRNTGNTLALVNSLVELRDMIQYPTISEGGKSDAVSMATSTRSADFDIPIQPNDVYELDHVLSDAVSGADLFSGHDLLRRHGSPFLKTFGRRSRRRAVKQKALEAHCKWTRRYGRQSSGSQGDKLTRPELIAILRSSRLLHYCRTPFLFSRYNEKWEGLEDDPAYREATLAWYQELTQTLMTDYARYLESVDMHLIDLAQSDTPEDDTDFMATSAFQISQNLSMRSSPVYLLRVTEGGSIICQVQMTSSYFSVTLFTLHRDYGSFKNANQDDRKVFQQFEELSGNFKHFIHVNSFVYDFHLRYIQAMFQTEHDLKATNLNTLYILRQFSSLHKKPAYYARNRLIHGFYKVNVNTIDRQKFFDHLLENSPKHGLSSIVVKSKSVGATVTSHDLSFTPLAGQPGDWKHTLIICPATNEEGIWIEYFILVVYQGPVSATSAIRNIAPVPNEHTIVDPLDAILLREGYTINDIAVNARNRLDTIVAEVLVYCKRHDNWSELHASHLVTTAGPVATRLSSLLGEFKHVDLARVDSNMASLLQLRLNWQAAFDMLIVMLQRKGVKDIRDNCGKRHLLLYHSRYMDYLVHLQLGDNNRVEGWMVSREESSSEAQGAIREQIGRLGNMLCSIIWMETVGRPIGIIANSQSPTPQTNGQ